MEPTISDRRFTFAEFIAKFPPIPMPVTLGEETHHAFSAENETLPDGMIRQYVHAGDPTVEDDEFTEYLPCFAIADTGSFIALVWWKAALLTYEYVLATFSPKGEEIDRRIIAFTRVRDNRVRQAVATLDEELIIYVAEGEAAGGGELFDPTASRTFSLEIMPNGQIVDG